MHQPHARRGSPEALEMSLGNSQVSQKSINVVSGTVRFKFWCNTLTCVFFFAGGSSPLTVAGDWGSGIEAGVGVSCGGWMNSG